MLEKNQRRRSRLPAPHPGVLEVLEQSRHCHPAGTDRTQDTWLVSPGRDTKSRLLGVLSAVGAAGCLIHHPLSGKLAEKGKSTNTIPAAVKARAFAH